MGSTGTIDGKYVTTFTPPEFKYNEISINDKKTMRTGIDVGIGCFFIYPFVDRLTINKFAHGQRDITPEILMEYKHV